MRKLIIFDGASSEEQRVLVRLEMGRYYKEFINSIPEKSKDREEALKHGVSCIVWGAFYLEATINDTSMKILEDGTKGIIKSADIVWPLVEKAGIEKKLEFILETLMPDEERKKRFAKQVESIFKLRNRLAHYKESAKEIESWRIRAKADDSEEEKIHAKIDAAKKVTPDIVDAILSTSIKDRRKIILEIGQWIEQAIFDYYKEKVPNA